MMPVRARPGAAIMANHHRHHHHRRRRRFRILGMFLVTVLPVMLVPILSALVYLLIWEDPGMESRLDMILSVLGVGGLIVLGVGGLIFLGVIGLRGFLDSAIRTDPRPPRGTRRPPRDPMYDPEIDGLPD
jgi:hypothetical protein